MFRTSTFFSSTLLLLASLHTAAAAELQFDIPTTLKQCHKADLNVRGDGPFAIEIYTSCADDSDAPVAVFEDVKGPIVWPDVNVAAGQSVFFVVMDVNGKELVSPDVKVEGSDAASCVPPPPPAAASSPLSTGAADAAAPTPPAAKPAPGSDDNYRAPNNVAKTQTDAPDTNKFTDSVSSAASSTLASRPLELAAGVLALACALSFY